MCVYIYVCENYFKGKTVKKTYKSHKPPIGYNNILRTINLVNHPLSLLLIASNPFC